MLKPIKPLKDEKAYRAALADIRKLWGSAPGSAEGDRLDILLALADGYERAAGIVPNPDPVEAIKVRMEDLGLTRKDLAAMLKTGDGRISEILNRRRALTLAMVRALADGLSLPAELLIKPYPLAPDAGTKQARPAPRGRAA